MYIYICTLDQTLSHTTCVLPQNAYVFHPTRNENISADLATSIFINVQSPVLTQIVGARCPMSTKKKQRHRQHDHDDPLPDRCTDEDHRHTNQLTCHRPMPRRRTLTNLSLIRHTTRTRSSTHDQDTFRSHSTTSHSRCHQTHKRIDHSGRSALIKLDRNGSIHDAPMALSESATVRLHSAESHTNVTTLRADLTESRNSPPFVRQTA